MNWDIIAENRFLFLEGAKLTLVLTFFALLMAFAIAVPLSFLRNSNNRAIRGAVHAYTLIFRGTPLLVQLFLIYFGLAQFELIQTSFLWPWLSSPDTMAEPTSAWNPSPPRLALRPSTRPSPRVWPWLLWEL